MQAGIHYVIFLVTGLHRYEYESCNERHLFYIYLLASKRNGTLYVGKTNDLVRRMYQHKNGLIAGFTKRYDVKLLMWFEATENPHAAVTRERQIKEWRRAWKIRLIEASNPEWRDLTEEIGGEIASLPNSTKL